MEEKEREEAEDREAEERPTRKFRGLRDSALGTRFDGDATMVSGPEMPIFMKCRS